MLGLPDQAVRERIHALWDELAAFEASEGEAALRHLMSAVADLVSAQNAFWIGMLRISDDDRDPVLGWRARAIQYLHSLPSDEKCARESMRWMARGGHDELTVAHARLSGRFRAPLLRELVSPAWFDGEMYKIAFEPRGIVDVLFVPTPINAGAEAHYGFQRRKPHNLFTSRERDIAAYAMRGLTWFHRQVMLSQGMLVARTPLSPMERRVVALLLTDQPEKVIADQLGVRPATVHSYITEVFRKFNVSGRAGLTALWLGRAG